MSEPLGDRGILCVSQFTLYGDVRKGTRPSWTAAAPGDHAEPLFGDLGFSLGLPIPIRSVATTRVLAALALPIVGRLPFRWIYPTGAAQSE